MSTIMKNTLFGALLFGLSPAVQAQEHGSRANPQTYNRSFDQQHAYGAHVPGLRNGDDERGVRAQRPDGRVTRGATHFNPVPRDDPPGSAFQDQKLHEDLD